MFGCKYKHSRLLHFDRAQTSYYNISAQTTLKSVNNNECNDHIGLCSMSCEVYYTKLGIWIQVLFFTEISNKFDHENCKCCTIITYKIHFWHIWNLNIIFYKIFINRRACSPLTSTMAFRKWTSHAHAKLSKTFQYWTTSLGVDLNIDRLVTFYNRNHLTISYAAPCEPMV